MEIRHGKKFIFEILMVICGNAVSAFAVACFALPYRMVVAGVSGIARGVEYSTGLSVTTCVYIISAALFILGLVCLGKKFAASILLGSVTFPVFLDIFQRAESLQHLVEDPLLAAICAGVLDGVGVALVLRAGGSTGGIDVPSIILNKRFGWKVSTLMYIIDVTIFLIQLPQTTTNGVILGILYALIYSFILDKLLIAGAGGIQMFIFSRKPAEINEHLLRIGYGTTLLHGAGGYLRDDRDVIYCVVSNRSLNRAKRAVMEIDDRAFITISNVSEVNGNGFTTWFSDEDYVTAVAERRDGADIMDERLESPPNRTKR